MRILTVSFFTACAVILVGQAAQAAPGDISTLAGTGDNDFGGDGGPATAASISNTFGIAFDSSGNLYFADTDNGRVRRINAANGVVTTVAGTGERDFNGDNQPATSADFDDPGVIVVDSNDHLIIADYKNSRIRRVDAVTGIVTTVVGTGTAGFSGDEGAATSAQINRPYPMAFDSSGNLFFGDTDNNRVRRVDAVTGVITTVAGNGTSGFSGDTGAATSAQLNFLTGLAVDESGNLFIASADGHRVRKVDGVSGIISTVAGTGVSGFSGDGAAASAAQLASPDSIAVDGDGNLFIGDKDNNRIRRVDAETGIITTIAGTGTRGFSGDGGSALLADLSPASLAFDLAGNLYFSDNGSHRIRRIKQAGVPFPGFQAQPDNIISGQGNNIYNLTGGGQTKNLVSKKARTVRAPLVIQNDGNAADTINLGGTKGNRFFKVIYTSGGNVTGQVIAGSFATGVLNPGTTQTVRVTIKPVRSSLLKKKKRRKVWLKKSRTFVLSSTSQGDPAKKDVAKVKVKHK